MSISSRTRLSQLPDWFSRQTASAVLEIENDKLSVYLNRWASSGLIQPLGKRTGMFLNLVVKPNPGWETKAQAIKFLYPEVIICGDSILNHEGWTTQRSSKIDLAILDRKTNVSIDGIRIHRRSAQWFNDVNQGILRQGPIPELKPEYVLADMVKRGTQPDVDDIEFDEIPMAEFLQVCDEMNVPKSKLTSFLNEADIDIQQDQRRPGNGINCC